MFWQAKKKKKKKKTKKMDAQPPPERPENTRHHILYAMLGKIAAYRASPIFLSLVIRFKQTER
jgi:hypothetical protein